MTPHEPHPPCDGSRQSEAHLDVMSLWDNNIFLGKQVWDAFLGNNVLNLQTREFRPRKRSPLPTPHHSSWMWFVSCACFHHPSTFSSPYRALPSPLGSLPSVSHVPSPGCQLSLSAVLSVRQQS